MYGVLHNLMDDKRVFEGTCVHVIDRLRVCIAISSLVIYMRRGLIPFMRGTERPYDSFRDSFERVGSY